MMGHGEVTLPITNYNPTDFSTKKAENAFIRIVTSLSNMLVGFSRF